MAPVVRVRRVQVDEQLGCHASEISEDSGEVLWGRFLDLLQKPRLFFEVGRQIGDSKRKPLELLQHLVEGQPNVVYKLGHVNSNR